MLHTYVGRTFKINLSTKSTIVQINCHLGIEMGEY